MIEQPSTWFEDGPIRLVMQTSGRLLLLVDPTEAGVELDGTAIWRLSDALRRAIDYPIG